jgi:ribosomal protein L39E
MTLMARNKDAKRKGRLVKRAKANRRAPVWVTLKTKSRDFIRRRTRHWRTSNLGKELKRIEKRE